MEKVIKVGIIGCGGIANLKHLPCIVDEKNVEIVAFCDIILERAVATRAKFGKPDAFVCTDYKEVLAMDEIDVVHVLTPNKAHAEISIAALHAGKQVMCEKPMAKSAADAQRMVDAARETGNTLTIGYQHRHKAESIYAKKFINLNYFGRLFIATNGDIYSCLYENPISVFKDSLKDVIIKELISEESSWRKIRSKHPCCNCIYQWLCPSPSSYENAIGKCNLCHINP